MRGTGDFCYNRNVNIQFVKKHAPDLIHFHFAPLGVLLKWIPEALKIPYTISIRGSELLIQAKLDLNFKSDFISFAKNSAGIHCVTHNLKEEVLTLIGEHPNISVIHTPVKKGNKISVLRKSKLRLIAVGRLHWVKNFHSLILACDILTKQNIEFELKIIGEGSKRAELEYMINDLGLQNYISLPGNLSHDEVLVEIENSDYLLITSWSEGFPNVFSEAVLNGTGVISVPLKGISELFNPNVDYIESKSNNFEDIFDAIIKAGKLSDSENDCMIISARGKAIKYHDPKAHAKQFNQFFQRALNQ